MKRFFRILLFLAAGLSLICVLLAGFSYFRNQHLPPAPTVLDRLDPQDKARLAESLHLKQTLGEAIWPGFGKADIPVVLWNHSYSFLVGAPDPPAGWEPAPGDDFLGQAYYRQPSNNPQNFAVKIGDRQAASIATLWETNSFFAGHFRDSLPVGIRDVFPYWLMLMPSEVQITAVEHESFHAYQQTLVPELVQRGEQAQHEQASYWAADPAMRDDWRAECDLLARALQAKSDDEAARLARAFLEQRSQRRTSHALTPAQIDFERSIEWEEGLAKYVEMQSYRAAATTPGYQPSAELQDDPQFQGYRTFEQRWGQEISTLKNEATIEDATRLYYTGMAQATLLDRFDPSWKSAAFQPDFWLEDRLKLALQNPSLPQ